MSQYNFVKKKPALNTGWNLDQGLALVQNIQDDIRQFNYHVALGGGVLNNGESTKDVDIYFLPMDNGIPMAPAGLLSFLEGRFGKSTPITSNEGYSDSSAYKHKVKFNLFTGQRIDAFIL